MNHALSAAPPENRLSEAGATRFDPSPDTACLADLSIGSDRSRVREPTVHAVTQRRRPLFRAVGHSWVGWS